MPYRRLVLWSPHDSDVYAATSPVDTRLFRASARADSSKGESQSRAATPTQTMQLLGVAPMVSARALAWHPSEPRVLAAAGLFLMFFPSPLVSSD